MPAKPCIFHINRPVKGRIQTEPGEHYPCGSGHAVQQTDWFNAKLECSINAPTGCDETKAILPTGLWLQTDTVKLIARQDGFAYYSSPFKIVDQKTKTQLYFRGDLALVFRSGSHQALGEACDARGHAEGWLVGEGNIGTVKYSLRATIVLKYDPQPALKTGVRLNDATANRLTGVLVKRS